MKKLKRCLRKLKRFFYKRRRKISRVLMIAALLEIVVSVVVVFYGEHSIANLEKVYAADMPVQEIQERQSVEEMVWSYIDTLELPKEAEVFEEAIEMQEMMEHPSSDGYPYSIDEENLDFLYRLAVAEAGTQDFEGKVMATNTIINRAIENKCSIIEVGRDSGQFTSVHNGEPCLYYKEADEWRPVTDDMISDELKEAVSMALQEDYTVDYLREIALEKGLDSSYYEGGALYFYNPNPEVISEYQLSLRENIKVQFQHQAHIFYRIWDR